MFELSYSNEGHCRIRDLRLLQGTNDWSDAYSAK